MSKKLTRICYPYVGREFGGSHISSLGLIDRLDRQRFDPVIVLQHPDGPIAEAVAARGLTAVASPPTMTLVAGRPFGGLAGLRAVMEAPRLAGFLRSLGVDIVHCNDGRTNALWALPARLAGKRVVWHNRGNPRARGLRLAAPLLAHRVVSVSRFASPNPGILSAARRNTVIHSPFDTEVSADRAEARETILRELNLPGDTRLVGTFGAIIPRKRPRLFVEAIAALRARDPDRPLMGLLFGTGPKREMRAVAAHAEACGVADCVRLMGFRSPGDWWIAGCEVLVVPAVEEPFGRTLIEAMLVGTPIVATRSGGNPEAIEDGVTGLLVPPENAEALAQGTDRLLRDDALRKTVSHAARAQAEHRYGAGPHAEAVMAIYDELLARHG
ncbi:glycosyltransferase family 4 protein [Parvularcula oceani]|uniref:glycosyltransferase family 4 protein n=1 Tax=Parvularcula oceani TaxID=1247963 RepID=UPI000AA1D35C|nr:glycosyltransferase family 4 protein [Parvularcula oceani]